MRLPVDNSITLTTDNDTFVADGSEMPAPTIDDVRALLPIAAQVDTDTAMRAGVLGGWRAMVNLCWARVGLTMGAQRSPRHASGAMLDAWGPVYGRRRAAGEEAPAYRARLLTPANLVTPFAIKAAIDALVAVFTNAKVNYQEPVVDAMFLAPVTANDPARPHASIFSQVPVWNAFIQPVATRLWANYPDKPRKTGAYLVPAAAGATIWLTFPGQPGDASGAPHLAPLSALPSWYGSADFVGFSAAHSDPNATINGAVIVLPPGTVLTFGFLSAAVTSLIDQVLSELEQRRGNGVRANVLLDPLFLIGK